MKFGAFVLVSSGFLSTFDPGCGAGVGSNIANGADASSGGSADSGGLPQMTCGALGSHFFCENFDNGSLPLGFDAQVTSAGTLAFDGKDASSTPRSLLATTSKITTSTRSVARLEKTFDVTGKRFTLSYAEWLDPACVGPYDGVETAVIGIRANNYWVSVRHGNPDHILETSLTGGLYVQGHNLRSSMPRGKWTKVTLDVDLVRNMIGLNVDGATIVSDEPLRYAPGNGTKSMIGVGVLTDNGTFNPTPCTVRIDDVAFDLQP
jgi:hypothetical protein